MFLFLLLFVFVSASWVVEGQVMNWARSLYFYLVSRRQILYIMEIFSFYLLNIPFFNITNIIEISLIKYFLDRNIWSDLNVIQTK